MGRSFGTRAEGERFYQLEKGEAVFDGVSLRRASGIKPIQLSFANVLD